VPISRRPAPLSPTVRPGRLCRGLAVLLVAGLAWLSPALAGEAALAGFAERLGLRDVAGFVETIETLERTGRLPLRYLTKDEARRLGWRPGEDLWDSAPGRAIGGDRFGNREGLLPRPGAGGYREADLDYAGGRRNARRLVYDRGGARWVTLDHYRSFTRVPHISAARRR